jgi:hypothetical protein
MATCLTACGETFTLLCGQVFLAEEVCRDSRIDDLPRQLALQRNTAIQEVGGVKA